MANKNSLPDMRNSLVSAGLGAVLTMIAFSYDHGSTPAVTTIERHVNDAMLSGKTIDTKGLLLRSTSVTALETLDVVRGDTTVALGERSGKENRRIRAVSACSIALLSDQRLPAEASTAFTSAVRDHQNDEAAANNLYGQAAIHCEDTLNDAIKAGHTTITYALGTTG